MREIPYEESLEYIHPELAIQWHPTKNGDLFPRNIKDSSDKKVWWKCENGHEWDARVRSRTSLGTNCPYCAGKKVAVGENDFETLHPNIAKEWNYLKNKGLKPSMFTGGSGKIVWWICDKNHEWQTSINHRRQGTNCPYCAGKKVAVGDNDFETRFPDLAKEWNRKRNGSKQPNDYTWCSGEKVWWQCSKKHEWITPISERAGGKGCPYCSGRKAIVGENDLASTNPNLAKEWHPTKNGVLTPNDVSCGSGKKVWWYLPYDDPLTGKHFDFEWEATVANRVRYNLGCPFLSGRAVWTGYNDLATRRPDLAAQWHPTKNGLLTPSDVTIGSERKVWWYYPHDDIETGKHFDFEWRTTVAHRTIDGLGCPFLSSQAVWVGYNDLATKRPDLVDQWHPMKNGELKPCDVTAYTSKKVWWYLSYDDPNTGKHFDFEWRALISDRTKNNAGCPYLCNRSAWHGYNDLETINPLLASQWHPTKNGSLTPRDVTPYSERKVWWYYPYDDPDTGKHFDFEWKATVAHRMRDGNGCPFLVSNGVWPGYNDLETRRPYLVVEWHPTKNGRLKPNMVSYGSGRKVWWICSKNHMWRATIDHRANRGDGCPKCYKNKE